MNILCDEVQTVAPWLVERVLIERWRQFYNEQRPHSALGYLAPAAARRRALDGAMINANLTA